MLLLYQESITNFISNIQLVRRVKTEYDKVVKVLKKRKQEEEGCTFSRSEKRALKELWWENLKKTTGVAAVFSSSVL